MLPTPCWEEATTRWCLCHCHERCLCAGERIMSVFHAHVLHSQDEGGGGVEIVRTDLAVSADRKSGGLQFDVSPLSARTGFQRIYTWSRKGLLPS